jgi:hypothetical protein
MLNLDQGGIIYICGNRKGKTTIYKSIYLTPIFSLPNGSMSERRMEKG